MLGRSSALLFEGLVEEGEDFAVPAPVIAASPSEPPAISLEAMQSATSAGDLEPSSKAVRHKAPMHRICTLFGRRQ